jgi:hypothetical protein
MSPAGLVALILANLVVALEALRHDWGYYETIMIYWCEGLIIGGYNVLRLLVVGLFGAQPFGAWVARWVDFGGLLNRALYTAVGIACFVAKFGAFALGVGFLVMALPAFLSDGGNASDARVLKGLSAVGPGVATAVAALLLSHGVSFVRNFLVGREYARLNVLGLIFWPYVRMSVVCVVLTLGLILSRVQRGLAPTTAFAVAMVLVKLVADAVTHSFEHRRIGLTRPPAG